MGQGPILDHWCETLETEWETYLLRLGEHLPDSLCAYHLAALCLSSHSVPVILYVVLGLQSKVRLVNQSIIDQFRTIKDFIVQKTFPIRKAFYILNRISNSKPYSLLLISHSVFYWKIHFGPRLATHFDWSLITGQLCTFWSRSRLIKTLPREWRWNQ